LRPHLRPQIAHGLNRTGQRSHALKHYLYGFDFRATFGTLIDVRAHRVALMLSERVVYEVVDL
jgi:hypothetical protein